MSAVDASLADVVLIVGASASGKSRLIQGAMDIAKQGGVLGDVRLAQRHTTRAARVAESLAGENEFVDGEEFERRVAVGEIDVHWARRVTADREIRYGFSLGPNLAQPGLVLLSANNYLQWQTVPVLMSLRAAGQLVVVRVFAADETRITRLRARRPVLPEDEFASRKWDVPKDELAPADHLIPNDPPFELSSPWELLNLLSAARYQRGA